MAEQVEAVGPADDQSRRLEGLLTYVVGTVTPAFPVILPVELRDETGFLVEQIRDTEELALEVEDRSVDLRLRQSGGDDVEDTQPRLPCAPGSRIGKVCS